MTKMQTAANLWERLKVKVKTNHSCKTPVASQKEQAGVVGENNRTIAIQLTVVRAAFTVWAQSIRTDIHWKK